MAVYEPKFPPVSQNFNATYETAIYVGNRETDWEKITNKPFEDIGDGLKVVNNTLMVDTADNAEQDNTKPITSAAVYTEIGNIDILLQTI